MLLVTLKLSLLRIFRREDSFACGRIDPIPSPGITQSDVTKEEHERQRDEQDDQAQKSTDLALPARRSVAQAEAIRLLGLGCCVERLLCASGSYACSWPNSA
jgi:hypothetical protein